MCFEDRSNKMKVASDILSNVKKSSNEFNRKTLKMKNSNARYPYKKRNPINYHKDNIAVASAPSPNIMTKRVSRPKSSISINRHSSMKHQDGSKMNDIVSKVQRLVPSKIKTVIDHWKFTKKISSVNPNWYLAEIKNP